MEKLAEKIREFSRNEIVNEILKFKKQPNIWRIIEYGKESYETRYSKMFRWLLDPKENHRLGTKFARALIGTDKDSTTKCNIAGAITEALNSEIDVFYFNEDDGETITIELKMHSKDHCSDNGRHQLDKYYDAVTTHSVYGDNEKYNNRYFYYITIDGSNPTKDFESKDKWITKSYSDVIEILLGLTQYCEDWDTLKIIKDFTRDMKSIVNAETTDFNEVLPKFESDEENILKLVNKYLESEFKNSENEKEFNDLYLELLKKRLYLDEIKVLLSIICKEIEGKTQNHDPNISVQELIRKLFEKFTGITIERDSNANLTSSERKGIVLEEIANKTGIKTINITTGKGQGLKLYYNDNWNVEERHAYMSGDYKGVFFNDSFSIFDPKTEQTIFKEKPKKFRSTSAILASEKLFQELFQYIIDKLAEFRE